MSNLKFDGGKGLYSFGCVAPEVLYFFLCSWPERLTWASTRRVVGYIIRWTIHEGLQRMSSSVYSETGWCALFTQVRISRSSPSFLITFFFSSPSEKFEFFDNYMESLHGLILVQITFEFLSMHLPQALLLRVNVLVELYLWRSYRTWRNVDALSKIPNFLSLCLP